MIKKSIICISIIIVAIAGGALVFANSQNHTNPTNPTQTQQNISTNNSTTNNSTNSSTSHKKTLKVTKIQTKSTETQIKISAAEAKKIAQSDIAEPGCIAGAPKLANTKDGYQYYVPIIYKGTEEGFIIVDAKTGEILGGNDG